MANFQTYHDQQNKSLQVEWIIPSPSNESAVSSVFYHPNAPTHHWRLKVAQKSGNLGILVALTHMEKNIQVKLHLRCDGTDVMMGVYEYQTKRGFGKTIPYKHEAGQNLTIFCEITVLGFGEWTENVMSQAYRMRKEDIFTDFEIRTIDEDVVKCHKLIVSTASPVIQAVASVADFIDSSFTSLVMNLLMDMLYGQPISSEISLIGLVDLLDAADFYRISHFKEALESIIRSKIESERPTDHIVQVMMSKAVQKNDEVMKSCFDLIRDTDGSIPIKDWFLICGDPYLCQTVNLNQQYLLNQTNEFIFSQQVDCNMQSP